MYYCMLNGAVWQLQGYQGLNFEKMFRYASFDLDDDVRHDVPSAKFDPEAARAALVSKGLGPDTRSSSLRTAHTRAWP